MTWETERSKAGRRLFRVIEIELDFCQLTYSESPCTAVLGTTGDFKCFNTRANCQDPENYDPAAKTYRFCDPIGGIPRLFDAIPSLQGIDMAPTVIDPGRSLGKRASINIGFADHPYHDRGIDKYVTERLDGTAAADGSSYNPAAQGTFFGKLRARNPFYTGRKLHVLTGFLPWDRSKDPNQQPIFSESEVLANLRRRTYVMEKWQGPDGAGGFSIEAKDVLKLADDKRAECPVQNTGLLAAGSGFAAGDATPIPIILDPAGVRDDEYGLFGRVLIGSELFAFVQSINPEELTLLARAQNGTEAADHDADDVVQEAKVFSSVRVDAIIQDLLENFANIDSAFIPITDWNAEADVWLSTHIFSLVIAEPVGVTKLLNEICEQAALSLWWHEIDQEIKLRAVRPQESAETITGDNAIIENVFSRRDRTGERLSQVVVRFDRINPVAPLDDPTSFKQSLSSIDTDAESSDQYNEKRIRKIFARWLGAVNRAQALVLANRMLARYRDDVREYRLTIGGKNANLWTGDVYTIQHRLVQGNRGEEIEQRVQLLEVEETEDGRFAHVAINDQFSGRYGFIGPNTLPDFGSATEEQKATYGWISENTGLFSDGSAAFRII